MLILISQSNGLGSGIENRFGSFYLTNCSVQIGLVRLTRSLELEQSRIILILSFLNHEPNLNYMGTVPNRLVHGLFDFTQNQFAPLIEYMAHGIDWTKPKTFSHSVEETKSHTFPSHRSATTTSKQV